MAPGSYYKNSGSRGHCGAPTCKHRDLGRRLGVPENYECRPLFYPDCRQMFLNSPSSWSQIRISLCFCSLIIYKMYFLWGGEVETNVIAFAEVESFLTVDIQLIGILCGNSTPIYPNASVEYSLLGAQCAYKACERAAETRLRGVQSFRTSAYWVVSGCGWALSTHLVCPTPSPDGVDVESFGRVGHLRNGDEYRCGAVSWCLHTCLYTHLCLHSVDPYSLSWAVKERGKRVEYRFFYF